MGLERKIEVIEGAIAKLEDPEHNYCWYDGYSCNCGVLAQTALDVSEDDLSKLLESTEHLNGWRLTIRDAQEKGDVCPATGLPMTEVFSALAKAGFTADELMYLEGLTDPSITGGEARNQKERTSVIWYMKRWKSLLEGQLAIAQQRSPQPQSQPVRVSV